MEKSNIIEFPKKFALKYTEDLYLSALFNGSEDNDEQYIDDLFTFLGVVYNDEKRPILDKMIQEMVESGNLSKEQLSYIEENTRYA